MQIYCSAAPIRRTREHERTAGRAKRVRSRLSSERKTAQKKCRSDGGRVLGCLVVLGASRGLVLSMLSNALLGNVHSKTNGSICLLQRGRVRLGEGRGDTHSARFLGALAGQLQTSSPGARLMQMLPWAFGAPFLLALCCMQ